MCLAIPGEVLEIQTDRPDLAKVDVSGVRRTVNVGLLTDDPPLPGEWVLIHVGFALSKIDETEARDVARGWCHRLEHEGGAAVLAGLERVDVASRSEAVREAHRVRLVYFANQAHRMDYPAYRAKGWLIGSGPVEAACKQVVGQRMKGSGMRWGEAGADALRHLRALFRSEKTQWDAYWASLAA